MLNNYTSNFLRERGGDINKLINEKDINKWDYYIWLFIIHLIHSNYIDYSYFVHYTQ